MADSVVATQGSDLTWLFDGVHLARVLYGEFATLNLSTCSDQPSWLATFTVNGVVLLSATAGSPVGAMEALRKAVGREGAKAINAARGRVDALGGYVTMADVEAAARG